MAVPTTGTLSVQTPEESHIGPQLSNLARGGAAPSRPAAPAAAPPPAHPHSAADAVLHLLWRRRALVLACVAASLAVGVIYLLLARPVYMSAARLSVQPAGPQIMGDGKGELSPENGSNFLNTQRELLTSTPILTLALEKPEVAALRTLAGAGNRYDVLKENVGADVGKNDDLITVFATSRYPEDAAKITNNVVAAYITHQARQKSGTAGEVSNILTKEKAETEEELRARTKEMLDFRRSHGVLSFDNDKSNITLQRLASLSDALTAAQLETFAAKAAYDEAVRSMGGDPRKLAAANAKATDGAAATPMTAAEEALLRADLQQWQAKLDDAKQNYLPGHPTVQALQRRVDGLNRSYVARTGRRYAAAREREAELQRSYDAQQADAIARSADAAEYQRLQSEVARLERLSEAMVNRIKEVQIGEASGAMNVTVVEWGPVPAKPHAPQKARVLGIALVLGVMLGVGAACVRDWRDPRLHTSDEIRAALGLPILGRLPRMPEALAAGARGQQVKLEPWGDLAEACRALRTAILFGVPDGVARTILVTSATPGDGKSTVASNLAIVLAQRGKRTLLVDADLRRPVQQEVFNVDDAPGLAGVLVAPGGNGIEAAIRPSGEPHLEILPAGRPPENPAELLNSQWFLDVLAELSGRYDHVVIDSPPATIVTDAQVLAAACDLTLLVVREGRVDRTLAEAARDALTSVGGFVMGIVVNGVQRSAGTYSAYYPKRLESTLDARGASRAPTQLPPGAVPGAEAAPTTPAAIVPVSPATVFVPAARALPDQSPLPSQRL